MRIVSKNNLFPPSSCSSRQFHLLLAIIHISYINCNFWKFLCLLIQNLKVSKTGEGRAQWNSIGLQAFTSFSLLPGFDVITFLLGAAIKLLYTPGCWEAAKLDQWGTWGQGIPPGPQGWGCCATSSSPANLGAQPQCPTSSWVPQLSLPEGLWSRITESLAAAAEWVSSPWRTSEAQGMWHHSAPSTIHVDLIAGARDVSPGPGLLEVTSHGAQELNWHQAGSAHQKLRDIFHKWPLIHLPFQECSSSSNLQALKGHDLGHFRLFVLNLMVPWQSHFYFPFHWAAVQTHIQGMVIWIHTFLTQPLTGAKQAPADSGSPNLAPNPAAPALSSHYPI